MGLWAIVKSDLIYNYKRLLLNVLFLLVFTASVITDLEVFGENAPASRIFWPVLVSIGSVVLVLISYKIGLKEERSRILLPLPVELTKVAYARLTAGAVQLTGAFIYLLIVHHFIINSWEPITSRVFYQFGSYTFIMSAILFIYYFVRRMTKVKMLFKVLLGVIMFLCCMYIVFFTDNQLFNSLPHHLLGLSYFTAGIILYFGSGYYYIKQNSYLEPVLLA